MDRGEPFYGKVELSTTIPLQVWNQFSGILIFKEIIIFFGKYNVILLCRV